MFHILANLDQEERWLGTTLSRKVQERISVMSVLLDMLAPADADTTIWTLAAITPDELRPPRRDRPPVMATGTPPQVDLAWCLPTAQHYNDRRFALELSRQLGCALPRAIEIRSLAELDAHLAAGPDAPWVVKAPWSSAGRHRVFGANRTLTGEARVAAERLIALARAVTYEPWLDRICDIAVCGVIGAEVGVDPPHTIHTDPRGGFRGIGLERPPLEAAEHDQLITIAERVAHALQEAGYRGPFGVDAFVYRDADNGNERRLHPLCEINARYTFGHVARALGDRLGVTRLGFDKWGRPELTARALPRALPHE